MKIGSSTIAMLANHSKDETHSVTENVRVWVDPPAQRTATDTVHLSQQYQSLIEDKNDKLAALDAEEAIHDDPKLLIIKKLIETLTGKTIALCKGPTANGFQELAALDQTNDGWIDENDDSFSRLYVWTRDDNGNNNLRSLKESGVGAIYTPAVETSFDLKNSENETEGRIQRTDIYLSENGQAGTVQQIDVAV